MKLKCPTCQTELRYIASSKFFLCNDCGYHIEGEPDPEPVTTETNRNGGTAIATSKPRITHPVLQKYKPWEINARRFLFLAMWISAIGFYITVHNIISPRGSYQSSSCQPGSGIDLNYTIFERCFPEGVTYDQVTEIIGSPGRLFSQSGSISIYQWDGQRGSVSMLFRDSRMMSKSQVNLAR